MKTILTGILSLIIFFGAVPTVINIRDESSKHGRGQEEEKEERKEDWKER